MSRTMIAFVALGLTVCATPYGPYECKGLIEVCTGYSEIQLAPDVYKVRFEGAANADTRARIDDYTLLRAAELALSAGFEHFVVLQTDDVTTTQTRSSPGSYSPPTTSCSGKGKGKVCVTSPGHWSGGGTYTASLPGYTYTVQFVSAPTDWGGLIVYEARSIQSDLRRKYQLPFAGGS